MDKPAILSNPEAFVVVPVEPVAWTDDGTTRAGSTGTSFRTVTNASKRDMPRAIAESFITPLFAAPNPTALSDIAAYCAELEEYARLMETGVAYWSGEPEGVTSLQLVFKERREQKARIAELEARLAEAERVIEPFADPSSGDTEGNDDDHCDVAVSKGELRALRAWKEKANG